MNDVQPERIFAAQPDQHADGGQLRFIGTRTQIRRVLLPIAGLAAGVEIFRKLCMD